MPPIVWSDQYSVGVSSIDKQHQVLIRLLNEAEEAYRAKEDPEKYNDLIKGLLNYTRDHFHYEEDLFIEYGYPERDAHEGMHLDLLTKVFEFEQKLEGGAEGFGEDIFGFLTKWLQEHILIQDKKAAKFLSERGVV